MKVQQRIRDQVRNYKPQQHISYEEWTIISDRALAAKNFFKDTNPIYIKMKNKLDEDIETITENRIYEVREERKISEVFTRVLVRPRKIQLDELVGEVVFIKEMFDEIKSWLYVKKDLEDKEGKGIITIDRGK